MVPISYCITTHNEGAMYIRPLLDRLLKHLQPEDEIVIVDDFSTDESTVDIWRSIEAELVYILMH